MTQICYSTNGLKNHDLTTAFSLIKQNGFDGIELAITNEHFSDFNFVGQIDHLNQIIQKTSANITNIHTGEPHLLSSTQHHPSLVTTDKSERQQRIDFIISVIKFSKAINCANVTIVSGLIEDADNESNAWENLEESLHQLISNSPDGITILIEQEPEMFINNTEHLLKLIDVFKGKIKINLDIGHLEVIKEDISESILALKDHILNIHIEDIKDNVHQHLLPGEGEIDFSPFFKTLKDINYQGYLTADLYPFSDIAEKALKTTHQFLIKYL
ncbi:MAG: hypothetical protein COA79_19710 [Planctomycetota bacterium]|nr:MAG: hypothetical protein COA79_19710 [Planctomycetota bacterium]